MALKQQTLSIITTYSSRKRTPSPLGSKPTSHRPHSTRRRCWYRILHYCWVVSEPNSLPLCYRLQVTPIPLKPSLDSLSFPKIVPVYLPRECSIRIRIVVVLPSWSQEPSDR